MRMIYRDFNGEKISALGLGCMRLPRNSFDQSDIDKNAVKEMVKYAIGNGVNYFDTAYGYHGGNSERVMGEVLSEYERNTFYLATKFPGYDLNNFPKVREIFEEQIEKCRVDYFDFYLFHCVSDTNIDYYLNPEYGVFDYIYSQKQKGRIKHLGFSCHSSPETLRRFLDAYGKYTEFGQLQLNYLDWNKPEGKENACILGEYNIPIWVMEPVRGGSLASLDKKYEEKLKALRPEQSIPAWAFRYLQTKENVGVILSGMSNMKQLVENIDTFKEEKPLNETEMTAINDIVKSILSLKTVPCTSCRYCGDYCTKKLDIPRLISVYNDNISSGGGELSPNIFRFFKQEDLPSNCIACRSCEKVCPQQIKITEILKELSTVCE